MRLVMCLLALLLPACAAEELIALDEVAFQRADEPVEGSWRPVKELQLGQGDGRAIWYRVQAPAVPATDPALQISGALFADLAMVGTRRVELPGMRIIPLGPAPVEVTLRAGSLGALRVPHFTAGSERSLWSQALTRELAPFVVGLMMVLAGLLLSSAGLRRGGERAYRGLGLFLLALGVLSVLNTQLRHLFMLRGEVIMYVHEVATTLYPVAFADFVLGIFGDGPRGLIRKGLRVFAAYAVVAWVLHFTGILHIFTGRAPVALFITAFLIQAIVLASRRARTQDDSARLFLWGIAALLVVSVPDILDAAGFQVLPFQTLPFAILAFGLAMVGVLERQHTQAREALASKLVALEERHREIDSLNQELRHQIAERSRQLGDALQQGAALVTQTHPLEPGDELDGRYRVTGLLGRGAMGAVHSVERLSDQRKFALKIMSGAADSGSGARFAREAEIAARVNDPHLVKVVDVGGAGSGRLYIVMEFVEGRPLEDHRQRFGELPWALHMLGQVTRGVVALHAAGVVHRDLKPANVLLSMTPGGKELAKISDFGISRLGSATPLEAAVLADPHQQLGAEALGATLVSSPGPSARSSSPQLTGTGAFIGTPAYMAPELAGGAHLAGPPSDMFALGLIAYELLSGRPAWPQPPLFTALSGQALAPVSPLPVTVPAEVAALVLACLAQGPALRPSAQECWDAIAAAGPW